VFAEVLGHEPYSKVATISSSTYLRERSNLRRNIGVRLALQVIVVVVARALVHILIPTPIMQIPIRKDDLRLSAPWPADNPSNSPRCPYTLTPSSHTTSSNGSRHTPTPPQQYSLSLSHTPLHPCEPTAHTTYSHSIAKFPLSAMEVQSLLALDEVDVTHLALRRMHSIMRVPDSRTEPIVLNLWFVKIDTT
jgi:hypothetical protein